MHRETNEWWQREITKTKIQVQDRIKWREKSKVYASDFTTADWIYDTRTGLPTLIDSLAFQLATYMPALKKAASRIGMPFSEIERELQRRAAFFICDGGEND